MQPDDTTLVLKTRALTVIAPGCPVFFEYVIFCGEEVAEAAEADMVDRKHSPAVGGPACCVTLLATLLTLRPKYNIIQMRYHEPIVFSFSALRLQMNNVVRVCFYCTLRRPREHIGGLFC